MGLRRGLFPDRVCNSLGHEELQALGLFLLANNVIWLSLVAYLVRQRGCDVVHAG